MTSALETLIGRAEPQIEHSLVTARIPSDANYDLLEPLLHRKNGFYAYSRALLVRPMVSHHVQGLDTWNDPTGWRSQYPEVHGGVFFAEDVFGCQFLLKDGSIYTFDPETSETEQHSTSLEDWAAKIQRDANAEVGAALASSWARSNGVLATRNRLVPKTPFVLGGKYEIANLFPMLDSKSMEFRASIYAQLKDLPDGAQIVLTTKP